MIIKLTRAQVKLLKPFYDAVWADKEGSMVVAQLGSVNGFNRPDEMRVGFIPAKKAKAFKKVAVDDLNKLPRAG